MNLKSIVRDHLGRINEEQTKASALLDKAYKDMLKVQVEMKKSLRRATVEEYAKWLEERYSVYKDRNISSFNGLPEFWIAIRNMDIYPLRGALALNIIVPENIRIMIREGLGHNVLYLHDGSTNPVDSYVYISDDLLKHL